MGELNIQKQDPQPGQSSQLEDNPKIEGPRPNIAFVGKEKIKVSLMEGEGQAAVAKVQTIDRELEPLKSINNGLERITLPSMEEQQRPFYHPKADTIIQLFPDLYKHYKEKG